MPVAIRRSLKPAIHSGFAMMWPQRIELETDFEKLPTRMTRSNPSKDARRGVDTVSKSAKISSSTTIKSCASASFIMRCAVADDSVAPVGLWMAEFIK